MASNVPVEERETRRRCCILIVFILVVLGIIAVITLVPIFSPKKPHYYAAIEAVSGLDPAAATDLGRPVSNQSLVFDITLGVASRTPFSSECFEPGAIVTVAYHGVQLACGITRDHACAAGWKQEQMVRTTVVVRGTGARLPGSVLDNLVADFGRGVAVFDVTVKIPSTQAADEKLVVCSGRQVGGAALALSAPCDVR